MNETPTKEEATVEQKHQNCRHFYTTIRARTPRQHKTTTPFRKQATLVAIDYTKKCLSLLESKHLLERDGTLQCSAGPEWYGCHGTFRTLASTWAPAVGRPSESTGCLAARKKKKGKKHAEHQTRNHTGCTRESLISLRDDIPNLKCCSYKTRKSPSVCAESSDDTPETTRNATIRISEPFACHMEMSRSDSIVKDRSK